MPEQVSELEKNLGMEVYATQTRGIGGVIRFFLEDFVVEEQLLDGSIAKTSISAVTTLVEPPHPEAWRKYLVCVLVKRGWDTILAGRRIAQQLGIDFRDIHMAGIKDTRAITAQHISLKNVGWKDLEKVRLEGVMLQPVGYSHRPVSPHILLGNHFHITIRNIQLSKTETEERIRETWKELQTLGGFPNFFGHQRFGTVRPITHKVGRALVKKNLEKAALTFLAEPSPFEHEDAREARRRLMEERDFSKALEFFPKRLKYERLMLKHLAKRPSDFAGAFRKLPAQLRRLFVQAYQSYLFNRFLSRRMRLGISLNEPQIGDFVVRMDKFGLPTPKHETASSSNIDAVKEEVRKGRACVALPLVGYVQELSRGKQGESEEEILEEEHVRREDFRIPFLKEISLKGRLRVCLASLKDFTFDQPREDSVNFSKLIVRLRFMLLRGCYATVVLREFMKPRDIVAAGF